MGLTRIRSATTGEGEHGCGKRGLSHEKLGRTPASGWLHRRLVRLDCIMLTTSYEATILDNEVKAR